MGERRMLHVGMEPCIECPAILTTNHCPKCEAPVCVMCQARKHPCTMPPPRPTVRTMSGETTSTGTDDIGQCSSTLAYDDGYGPETLRCARTDGHGRLHRAAGEEWLSDAVPSCADPTEAP